MSVPRRIQCELPHGVTKTLKANSALLFELRWLKYFDVFAERKNLSCPESYETIDLLIAVTFSAPIGTTKLRIHGLPLLYPLLLKAADAIHCVFVYKFDSAVGWLNDICVTSKGLAENYILRNR